MEKPTPAQLPATLIAQLDETRAAIEAVISEFKQPWATAPAPELIYHYSTLANTKAILQSGTLWLSDIFRMNDQSEIAYGVEFAIKLAQELGAQGNPMLATFADHFAQLSRGGITRSAHYFVASLSTNGDELGQWRAYADDGKGCALCFDGAEFEQAFAPQASRGEGNTTFPMRYDSAELRALQERIVRLVEAAIVPAYDAALTTQARAEFLRRVVLDFALAAFSTAIFFKHPAYRAEDEYRFLNIQRGDQPPIGTATRETVLGPCNHLTFDWRKYAPNSLRKIVIGPAADESNAAAEIRETLTKSGYAVDKITIEKSPMPYRSMRK